MLPENIFTETLNVAEIPLTKKGIFTFKNAISK